MFFFLSTQILKTFFLWLSYNIIMSYYGLIYSQRYLSMRILMLHNFIRKTIKCMRHVCSIFSKQLMNMQDHGQCILGVNFEYIHWGNNFIAQPSGYISWAKSSSNECIILILNYIMPTCWFQERLKTYSYSLSGIHGRKLWGNRSNFFHWYDRIVHHLDM